MSCRIRNHILGFVTLVGLTGCSAIVVQERPPWRAQAENACLARGNVRDSAVLVSAREINGPGICGLTHPFKVTALAGGTVTVNSTQTLDCPMIEALDGWIRDVVQPAAQARFGEPVVRINAMGSYSCRGINNMSGASLSEHAFGNALDIGGFVLASGRELNIMRGFNGPEEQENAFLHEVHAGACGLFTTVLGPGYNALHDNHIHVDLATHGSTSRGPRRYCKPVPKSDLPDPPQHDTLPDPPAIEEEMDIARAPMPEPGLQASATSLVAAMPVQPPTVTRAAAYSPVPPQGPVALSVAGAASPPARRQPALAAAAHPATVTFAVEDPAPAMAREPIRRRKASVPTVSDAAPPPAGEDDDPSAGETAVTEPATVARALRPRPRRPEGQAAEWDITSSIHRSTGRAAPGQAVPFPQQ